MSPRALRPTIREAAILAAVAVDSRGGYVCVEAVDP